MVFDRYEPAVVRNEVVVEKVLVQEVVVEVLDNSHWPCHLHLAYCSPVEADIRPGPELVWEASHLAFLTSAKTSFVCDPEA